MGICFDCLITIDSVANRQSCQVEVAEGMVIQSQQGLRVIDGRVPE
jgi:predicted molibdopterin-dependent oxidoreductase YjgC